MLTHLFKTFHLYSQIFKKEIILFLSYISSIQQEKKKAISVIRIKPSEMSRVRKESEKYADNGSDSGVSNHDRQHHNYREVTHNRGGYRKRVRTKLIASYIYR